MSEHGDKSLSLLKGVILVGPIAEHNMVINFDLQHKDCVCGMAYYQEKGTRCRAINGYSLLSRIQSYRVVDWVFVFRLGRAENRNWTVAWCGQLQSAPAAVTRPLPVGAHRETSKDARNEDKLVVWCCWRWSLAIFFPKKPHYGKHWDKSVNTV